MINLSTSTAFMCLEVLKCGSPGYNQLGKLYLCTLCKCMSSYSLKKITIKTQ